MNPSLKILLPVAAALTIAACNAGGSSNVPSAGGGAQSAASRSAYVPQWKAKNLAHADCPMVARKNECMALTVNGTISHLVPSGLGPTDLQTAYNLPSSTNGAGQIVAIVDAYDNPKVASDLAAYRTQYGLGTANFTKYNQEGQTSNYPSGNTGWGTEEDLDVDMVSAGCPKCTIYLIEANSNNTSDLETAVAEAVTLGAHIVSNSYLCAGSTCGWSESYFESPGVEYIAASGDDGYNENGPPEYFGSVVSAGGTQLTKSGSKYSETVWSDAGGGCSDNGTGASLGQPKPAWQKDPDCKYRTDSDVSSEAGCNPGVAEYDTYGSGGWIVECGTSAASPMTAAVFALAGNASSQNAAEHFWKLKAKKRNKELHYISVGNDGSCNDEYLCTAGTKQYGTYSGPAGWGSPNGVKAY
ncbi:MAG: peptidase S8 [Candidatus Eremiobacteraeota bacterium]|nr:peptidase S8 [Candidatus Eremiobacteraeota bacterium]